MKQVLIAPGWQAGRRAREADRPRGAYAAQAARGDRIELADALSARLVDEPDPALCWQAALTDALDLIVAGGSINDVPAANTWAEDTGLPSPASTLLRADPVGLAPDRDSAVLQPPEALGLESEESRELLRDINAFIQTDGLTLHAAAPCRWYLAGQGLPRRFGASPEALAFHRQDPGAPRTTGAPTDEAERRLRRLGSELEMLLHAHPVNERRRGQGRHVVASVHLWGVATAWSCRGPDSDGALEPPVVVGDDAFTRTAAAAAGVRCEASVPENSPESCIVVDLSLRDAWLCGDTERLAAACAQFEQERLRPALDRFDTGKCDAVLIRGDAGIRSRAQSAKSAGNLVARLRARLTGLFGRT